MSYYRRPYATADVDRVRLHMTPFSSRGITPQLARELADQLRECADQAERVAGRAGVR